MKTVSISKAQRAINDLLKQARKQNLILRSPDGREFILAKLDDFDREVELTRGNRELIKLLDQRSQETETVSLQEARTRLGLKQRIRQVSTCYL